jgi:DNA polymerase-3 subunit alpha
MILDIETTGLSPYSSYIVQIAYNIYDYNLNLITKKNIIINNGNNIQDFYKKIPLDVINNRGITLIGALNEVLMDMKNCRYIVGHNISFDINFIETKFWKNNIYHNYNYKAICTMKKSRKFVNAKNKSNGIKPPKLCELYKKIYNKDMDENSSHTADYDVEITFQCFKKLVELEIIELD